MNTWPANPTRGGSGAAPSTVKGFVALSGFTAQTWFQNTLTGSQYGSINSHVCSLGVLVYPTSTTLGPAQGDFFGNRVDNPNYTGPCYFTNTGTDLRVAGASTGALGEDATPMVTLTERKLSALVFTSAGGTIGDELRLYYDGVFVGATARTFSGVGGGGLIKLGWNSRTLQPMPNAGFAGGFLCDNVLTPAQVADWIADLREAGAMVAPPALGQGALAGLSWAPPRFANPTIVQATACSTSAAPPVMGRASALGTLTSTKLGLSDCTFQ